MAGDHAAPLGTTNCASNKIEQKALETSTAICDSSKQKKGGNAHNKLSTDRRLTSHVHHQSHNVWSQLHRESGRGRASASSGR